MYIIIAVLKSLAIRLIIFGSVFCSITDLKGQEVIPKKATCEYYEYEGVIFPEECKLNFFVSGNLRYTPCIGDVIKAEEILISKYNETLLQDSRVHGFKPVKKVKKFFFKYARQYVGFYDRTNNKHFILLQVLNFNISSKEMQRFSKFKEQFITGFGEFFGTNTHRYLIDIDNYSMQLF